MQARQGGRPFTCRERRVVRATQPASERTKQQHKLGWMFSSLGGGRGSTHTSMSSALPMIFIFVLLAGLPLSASSSTRSSRSCHLAVAEDRLALPARRQASLWYVGQGVSTEGGAPTCSLSPPVQVFGNSPCIRRVWRSFTPENRTAGQRYREGSNDEPRPSPPEGGMRHQATASRPPAAPSRSLRLLARWRDWS